MTYKLFEHDKAIKFFKKHKNNKKLLFTNQQRIYKNIRKSL